MTNIVICSEVGRRPFILKREGISLMDVRFSRKPPPWTSSLGFSSSYNFSFEVITTTQAKHDNQTYQKKVRQRANWKGVAARAYSHLPSVKSPCKTNVATAAHGVRKYWSTPSPVNIPAHGTFQFPRVTKTWTNYCEQQQGARRGGEKCPRIPVIVRGIFLKLLPCQTCCKTPSMNMSATIWSFDFERFYEFSLKQDSVSLPLA